METREQQLVMILADISGYTKFMVENQLAAVHGQLCITFLIFVAIECLGVARAALLEVGRVRTLPCVDRAYPASGY